MSGFGSGMLEVALGMALIYTVLSLLCTTINEQLAQWTHLRAWVLEQWIRTALSPGGSKAFYDSAMIKSISGIKVLGAKTVAGSPDKVQRLRINKPSYIHPNTFALAILDLVAPAGQAPAIASTNDLIGKIDSNGVIGVEAKQVLTTLVDSAQGNVEKARENIEAWFDNSMDRVNGWYARWQRYITLAIALGVVVALNADSVRMFRSLWHAPQYRAMIAARAPSFDKQTDLSAFDAPLPLGWGEWPRKENGTTGQAAGAKGPKAGAAQGQTMDANVLPSFEIESNWPTRLLGWLITVLAVSLGAPFWFGALNKITSIKTSGPAPAKPTEKK
jgi:hypothetical protein